MRDLEQQLWCTARLNSPVVAVTVVFAPSMMYVVGCSKRPKRASGRRLSGGYVTASAVTSVDLAIWQLRNPAS